MDSCLELIPDDIQRIFVAFSGGLDSTVLLHLLVQTGKQPIIPWHINHGLQDVALQMETFCIARAQSYNLEIRIDHLALDAIKSNVEAEARRQRYHLFQQRTQAGDCVLTAHHADDQAETFLLNALRGSGSAGLRGIARQRKLGDTLLLRPLLDFSRSQLEAYANQHELPWFNDPSNQTSRFDRNYLRQEVLPQIRNRWPSFQQGLATSSEIQAETQEILEEIATQDYLAVKLKKSGGYDTLDVSALLQLSTGRCKNLLRYWISQAGFAVIPHARLEELMNQFNAGSNAVPEIAMPGYSVRIYDQRLFLVETGEPGDFHGSFDFGQKPKIEIAQFDLRMTRRAIFKRLKIEDHDQALTLKFRSAGQQNSDRHRLKRLFQKHRVPPWQRSTVAQVYLDGQLEGLLL